MKLRSQELPKLMAYDQVGQPNGFIVPIYNIHDGFFKPGFEPQQVNLTVIPPGGMKGPHLHRVRTGFFACLKGTIRIVAKLDNRYLEYVLSTDPTYKSLEIPTGIPTLFQNIGDEDAFVISMWQPAWTPDMNDEDSIAFSDYQVS